MAKELLPGDFLNEIQEILPAEEVTAFVESYEAKRAYGLRYNPLKGSREAFLREMPFDLRPVSWSVDGYYCDMEDKPGKSAYHEAGAYYIQEPSAMVVADLLEVKPGDIVCDLCAAPGGKSTQLAGAMMGEGLLVSNEIVPSRAKILAQNIERMGVKNAVVCNEPPDRMAKLFPNFFDKILVDAPCSGEGMFRKNPEAITEWSLEQVEICRERQLDILNQAKEMLKPGGVLVYSTCTFNRSEDEGIVETFLSENADFSLVKLSKENGVSGGLLEGTVRVWPHKAEGEGHFAAKLVKQEGVSQSSARSIQAEKRKEVLSGFLAFQQEFLQKELKGTFVSFGDELYLVPEQMCDLKGIKVVRAGLHLGTNKKNRFEPAQALAMALSKEDVKNYVVLKEPQRFISGEGAILNEMSIIGEEKTSEEELQHMISKIKGWTLVCCGGYSIGWGKVSAGNLKNHYPKGLRKNL